MICRIIWARYIKGTAINTNQTDLLYKKIKTNMLRADRIKQRPTNFPYLPPIAFVGLKSRTKYKSTNPMARYKNICI
jgi:hypothetical protein